ncbi:hypothetical protein D3C85_1103380 [compost metagenome]
MGNPSRTNQNGRQTILLATNQSQSVLAEVTPGDVNRMTYSAYGHLCADRQTSPRLGFNGELREHRTHWYMLGNGYRTYNPVLMRFHSPDKLSPFGDGGLNPYMYCIGDPINYQDPTGRAGVFNIGSLLLKALTTPTGVLTAASIATGIAALAIEIDDPGSPIGTALIIVSAATGLGAGYRALGRGAHKNLAAQKKKTGISRLSAKPIASNHPPSYASLFPNSTPGRKPIKATPLRTQDSRTPLSRETLQGTTVRERKDYWPGAQAQERERQLVAQQQEAAQLMAEFERVTAVEERNRIRNTRPPLQRQNANMRT